MAATEDDGRPAGEEVRPQPAQVPGPGELDRDGFAGIVVASAAEPGEVATVQDGVGNDEREGSARSQVLLGGAGDEQPGQVLVGGDLVAVSQTSSLGQLPEGGLHVGGHVPVGQPRWVADQDVYPVAWL